MYEFQTANSAASRIVNIMLRAEVISYFFVFARPGDQLDHASQAVPVNLLRKGM